MTAAYDSDVSALAEGRSGRVQDRVLHNDERVLDACVTLIERSGWGGFHPAGVAATADMSKRAVLERGSDRDSLAAAAWQRRAWPALEESIEAVLQAGGAGTGGEDIARPGAHASGTALARAVEPLLRPSAKLAAAMELTLVAGFHDVLDEAVRQKLTPRVSAWLSGTNAAQARTLIGQRGYLVMLATGLLMAALRRRHMPVPDLEAYLEGLATALHAAATPVSLPADDAPHMDLAPTFDTGDPGLDRLLRSALLLIGTRGFDDTSVEAICRDAGVSQGFLFGRYASKLELFTDASRRQQSAAYATNSAFLAGLDERYGPGLAQAVIIREVQQPERRHQNVIFLEQVRMAWHDDRLRDAQEAEVAAAFADEPRPRTKQARSEAYAGAYVSTALGLGASLMPRIYAQAHLLPYDVVTKPLLG